MGKPLPWVTLREEHTAGNAVGCRFESEADTHEQVLPARHVAHLILDGLLCGVHGVTMPAVDALQRLLHLRKNGSHDVTSSLPKRIVPSMITIFLVYVSDNRGA